MRPTAARTRFHTLDALRGIAALGVMLYHAGWQAPLIVQRGYLGADLFFVLSGFVIAHAYGGRLREGMGIAAFARARLIRIYPMFWIGALLGCLLFRGSPLMLLMIPTASPDGLLFRANAPLWSLLFELLVNLGYALIAPRLGWRGLLTIIAASGAVMTSATLANGGADLGAYWDSALAGIVRTTFSFSLGVALHRLHQQSREPGRRTAIAWILLLALALLLVARTEARALWDLATISLAFPAIVWFGARIELPAPRLGKVLGGISYPLYCIHAPIVAMCHGSTALMTAACVALVLAAWALDRWFDQPLQRLVRNADISRAALAAQAP